MPIRFRCMACSQPIEVDEEWASRTVACPYCRKTITAPAESTLTDLDQAPMASPVDTAAAGTAQPPVEPRQVVGLESSTSVQPNRLAVVALILACCSIGLLVTVWLVFASHQPEFEEMEQAIMHADSFTEKMEAQSKFLEAHPELIRRLYPASMLAIAGGLANLGAFVCGVIAIRRLRRRGLAVAALVIAGFVPVFFCYGALSG